MLRRSTSGEFLLNTFLTVFLGSIVTIGGFTMYQGVDPLRAHVAGTAGYVTVSSCVLLEKVPGTDGYECHGVFNGAGLRVENVLIDDRFQQEPVNPVAALVTGPDADTAHTPGWDLLVPFAGGSLIAGLGLFHLGRWWLTA